MRIIVVGCGRTGALLAQSLSQKGHQVVVVDNDPSRFWRLGPEFRGRTVEGVGFDREVLIRAGIEEADAVAVVTDDDMTNLIVAHAARQHFHVANVVARLFDPDRAVLYQAIGVPVVTTVSWRVTRLEQLLCQPSLAVMDTLGNGEVLMVNLRVPQHWAGRAISSLAQEGKVVPTALVRGGNAQVATPQTLLEAGDVVCLAVATGVLGDLQETLLGKAGG